VLPVVTKIVAILSTMRPVEAFPNAFLGVLTPEGWKGPRNVLTLRGDWTKVVRPFRGLRKTTLTTSKGAWAKKEVNVVTIVAWAGVVRRNLVGTSTIQTEQ
jgi:hypothetical protein